MGNSIYFTAEYIPDANCSLQQFIVDDTCGPSTGHPFQQNISPRVENANKRTFFGNWGTSLNKATLASRTTKRSGRTTPLTAKVGGRRGESPAALFV